MKKMTPLLIILVAFFDLNGQSFDFVRYRTFYNKAQYEFVVNGNYKQALNYFNELTKFENKNLPNSNDFVLMSICYLNLKDTISALKSLERSVLKGNTIIEEQTWLINMFNSSDWKRFTDKLPKLKDDYWSYISNKEVYCELIKLEALDQGVRTNFIYRIPNDIYDKMLEITDSINFYKLDELVRKKEANPLCFLMYHIYGKNSKYYNYYDSVFNAKIYKGEADPSIYAHWVDRQRIYVNHLTTQLYGEWNEFGSKEFNPIEDIKNVDSRRAKIGLCTLADYAKIVSLNLPKEYLPPKN